MQQQETDNSGSAGSRFQPQGPVRILKRPSSQPSQMCQEGRQQQQSQPHHHHPSASDLLAQAQSQQQQQQPHHLSRTLAERQADYTEARLRILGPDYPSSEALEANPDLLPDPSATVSSNSGKQQQQSPASSTTVLRPDSEPFIPRLQSQFASTPAAAAAAAAAAATKSSKNSNSNNQATLSQS
ncbi:hypothetical protein BOX15_Mlig009182g1 [Macrostomum lignano]|uniref:SUZ domain-containing protein n=1 Tax=Macrostomum lignano TaxID=282301 RepID=A0A267F709_9PLAT|nr:hypothetical protein BOX15_Mlig032570g2 [Macrostomum lignano]PAA93449.1 hypothetical protein BOX15_Mlig009182g1 [Macrostomum lignano]